MYKNPLKKYLDRFLHALADMFPGKSVKARYQELQVYFDQRVYQHTPDKPLTVNTADVPLPSPMPMQAQQRLGTRARATMHQWQEQQKSGDLLHRHTDIERQQRFVTRKLSEPDTMPLPGVKPSFGKTHLAPLPQMPGQAFPTYHVIVRPVEPEPHADSLEIEEDNWLNSTPVEMPTIETPPEVPRVQVDDDATESLPAIMKLRHAR